MESPTIRAERKLNMATKKSTPETEIPAEEEKQVTDPVSMMRAELEALKKENERLKQNSVQAYGAAGAKSDYERVQEACQKAAEEGADAWGIKISIRAPRRPAKEDPFYWVSVNDRQIQIPANDKYYDLALPFAACLVDMIAAEWMAADFADNIENYDPVTNPHRE